MSNKEGDTQFDHTLELRSSEDYYCVVVKPPVRDVRKADLVRNPRPGISAKIEKIIGMEHFFLFDRSTIGWKDGDPEKPNTRGRELIQIATAMAKNIVGDVIGFQGNEIDPGLLGEAAELRFALPTLEDMDRTGKLATPKP